MSGDGPSPNTPGLVATQQRPNPDNQQLADGSEPITHEGARHWPRRPRFRPSRKVPQVTAGSHCPAIDEVLAERGEDKTTELLVSWKNNSYARPSWTLLTELKKNPTNIGVIAEYYETGQRTIEEVDINELEQET